MDTRVKNRTRYVIFDFDGTIADSIPLMIKIYNAHLAKKYKLDQIKNPDFLRDIDLKSIMKMTHLPFYRMIFFIRRGKKLFEQKKWEIRPFTGMKTVIKRLSKDYALGIVSSNSVENINYFLKKNNLDGSFSFVISEKSLFGKHKALKKVIAKNKIAKKEVIYVGDEVRDIIAARKAQIRILSVAWGHNSLKRLKEEKPDFIAKKPMDLLRFLKIKKKNYV